MSALRATVEALVAAGQMDEALAALSKAVGRRDPELSAELVVHQAGLKRTATNHRRGLIDGAEFERAMAKTAYALLGILDQLEDSAEPTVVDPPAGAAEGKHGSGPSVFLSYSHDDGVEAAALRDALETRGIAVHVDGEAMEPGEGIRAFVERSIRDTDATICLVSNRSLSSAWVAMETMDAFQAERSGRRFIACYIDEDFFDPAFRLACTERIDAKITEIEALIPAYIDKRLDTNELNAEKSRLYALRNNLGDVLLRLKESLTLDVRDGRLAPSADRIARTLLG